MTKMWLVLSVAILALGLALRVEAAVPVVGQTAPGFEVIDQHGSLQRLADYRGKWVVLYFYPKDDTPGCTAEACAYRDDLRKLQGMGAVVVGVSIDDAESHAEFAAKHHLPFPLLADRDGKVATLYGSQRNILGYKLARRNTFIIDPEGRIAKTYQDVDAKRNPEEVIVDLGRLQSHH